MDVRSVDEDVANLAGAIGEPVRARMLYCLVDGHARTSTELAAVAEIGASTASAHLQRLLALGLVRVLAQGKHRYYSLGGANVAAALEALSVLASGSRKVFVPNTPTRLRSARTCYDHIAGVLGVGLHDCLLRLAWLVKAEDQYRVTGKGAKELSALGVDLEALRVQRRRFAYACVDWSERRPHVGGALGAALLGVALRRRWVAQDLDCRALRVTGLGRKELLARFALES